MTVLLLILYVVKSMLQEPHVRQSEMCDHNDNSEREIKGHHAHDRGVEKGLVT